MEHLTAPHSGGTEYRQVKLRLAQQEREKANYLKDKRERDADEMRGVLERGARRDRETTAAIKDGALREAEAMREALERQAVRQKELADHAADQEARERRERHEHRQREEAKLASVPYLGTMDEKLFKTALHQLPDQGQAFADGLDRMVQTSPKIAVHLGKLFSGKAALKFDPDTPSACFDAKNNEVIMPGKGKAADVPDMVDAFLFESCNVERAADYAALHDAFVEGLGTKPMSFADYGAAKARIECEATTRQVNLLFDLYDSGGELALAGKRNLLSTGEVVLRHQHAQGGAAAAALEVPLKQLAQFKLQCQALDALKARAAVKGAPPEMRDQVAALTAKVDAIATALLAAQRELLRGGLALTDTNPDAAGAVLDHFVASRHNVNKGERDKGFLCTRDMYAFEQMEALKPQDLTKMARTVLLSSAPKASDEPKEAWESIENNWPAIEKWMDDMLRQYELNDEETFARQKVLLDVIAKIETDFPELGDRIAAAFGFTEDMKKVAQARFDDMVGDHKAKWDERKDLVQPPTKGWCGKAPVPLKEVKTCPPTFEAGPGHPRQRDVAALATIGSAVDGAARFRAVANGDAGVNSSFKVKAAVEEAPTVALFKPRSAFAGSEKVAQCFKKPGAKEAREVACSAWNEMCGGLGDYPVTVPAEFDGQKGSLMAWRGGGTQEFSDFTPDPIELELTGQYSRYDEIRAYLEKEGVGAMKRPDGSEIRVSLDGREGTRRLDELRAECEASVLAKQKERDRLVESIDDNDAQNLMALHVATLQLDAENSNNVMFTKQDGRMKPFAIDGGLSAPEKVVQSDLKAPLWLTWPQASKGWTPEQQEKFKAIDIPAVAKTLREQMAASPVGSLEEDSVLRMMASTQSLVIAAQVGLPPRLTWTFIQGMEQDVVAAQRSGPKDDAEFLERFAALATPRAKLVGKEEKPVGGSEKNQTIGREIDRLKRAEEEARQASKLNTTAGARAKLVEVITGHGIEALEELMPGLGDLENASAGDRAKVLKRLREVTAEQLNKPFHVQTRKAILNLIQTFEDTLV